jgi:hypothetical protein
MAGKRRFRNSVPACVLLRKIFLNGVPARSVTNIPLIITIIIAIIVVALGGLVVSVLATGPMVVGSNPAEDDGF